MHRFGRVCVWSLAGAVMLAALACNGVSSSERRYGFRYDPSLVPKLGSDMQSVLVRSEVLHRPDPGDRERLEAVWEDLLSDRGPDGLYGGPSLLDKVNTTGSRILEFLNYGCSPDDPRFEKLVQTVRGALHTLTLSRQDALAPEALVAYCRVGLGRESVVAESLRRVAGSLESAFTGGDPWEPALQIMALWAGRKAVDADLAVETGLTWLERNLASTGCGAGLGLCDPWSIVALAGTVDHPLADKLAWRLAPMLLRAQRPDASWGGRNNRTVSVYRMLVRTGMLDTLRAAPPLPADWRVLGSHPIPCDNPGGIVWLDGKVWVEDRDAGLALGLSSHDGSVEERAPLPGGGTDRSLGVWGDHFGVTVLGDRRQVLKVSRHDGDILARLPIDFAGNVESGVAFVNGMLLIPDGWEGSVWTVDPARPLPATPPAIRLAAALPRWLAASGSRIWAADAWAPVLVCSDMEGNLVDWGEKPCRVAGIAFNGEDLYIHDADHRRICHIARADRGDPSLAWLAQAFEEPRMPVFADGAVFEKGTLDVRLRNTTRLPVDIRYEQPHASRIMVEAVPRDVHLLTGEHADIRFTFTGDGPVLVGDVGAIPLERSIMVSTGDSDGDTVHDAHTAMVVRRYACGSAPSEVVVDGRLGEWDDLPIQVGEPEEIKKQASSWRGSTDSWYRFAVAHDDAWLYVAVEVHDDEVVSADGFSWAQDGVELFVQGRPLRQSSRWSGLQLALSPRPDAGEAWTFMPASLPDGTRCASRYRPGGYAAEIAIPHGYLNRLFNGRWEYVRINVAVNDRDRDGQACLWWKPDWRTGRDYPGSGTFLRSGEPTDRGLASDQQLVNGLLSGEEEPPR